MMLWQVMLWNGSQSVTPVCNVGLLDILLAQVRGVHVTYHAHSDHEPSDCTSVMTSSTALVDADSGVLQIPPASFVVCMELCMCCQSC
jgi:hypothetical protein